MQRVPDQMTGRDTSAEIDDTAALWAARIDARPLSPSEEQALDLWLSADTRRQGAFARARAISMHMARAKALGPGFSPQALSDRLLLPRRLVLASAVVATVGVAVAAGFATFKTRRFRTGIGEVRVVSLEDGSVVTLDTASQIAVAFSDVERVVDLIKGKALFESVAISARPFVVRAGNTIVRTLGASFSVAHLADAPVNVLVRTGIVDVSRQGPGHSRFMRVNAMELATLTPASAEVRTEPAGNIERRLAWRDGRLAFEGETLKDAAREFERYSRVRIVFADPSIAQERITGLYVSTDPIGFAEAVGMAFDLHVTVREDEVVLSR